MTVVLSSFSYYRFTQTGPKTATMKFESEKSANAQDTQAAKPSFVVSTTPSIVAAKALIEVLFGLRSFDEPARPRFSATPQKSRSSGDLVFTFTRTERERETRCIRSTSLYIVVGPDGIFSNCITEPARPPAQPLPRVAHLDVKPTARQAPEAPDSLSWGHLPSRAGREASGMPSFGRTTAGEAVIRQAPTPIEPQEIEVPQAPVEPQRATDAEPFVHPETVVTDAAERPVEVTEVRDQEAQDAPIPNAPLPAADYADALIRPDPIADYNQALLQYNDALLNPSPLTDNHPALAQYAHELAQTPFIPEPLPADPALQSNMAKRKQAHADAATEHRRVAFLNKSEAQHCLDEAKKATEEEQRLLAWTDYYNAQAQTQRADDDKQADQAEESRQNAIRHADAARDFNKRAQHFREEAVRYETAAAELLEKANERQRMAADLADQIEMHGGAAV